MNTLEFLEAEVDKRINLLLHFNFDLKNNSPYMRNNEVDKLQTIKIEKANEIEMLKEAIAAVREANNG